MKSEIYPLNSLRKYKYVAIFSVYKGKLLLSRQKKRFTWETQGGHIEPGETPYDAACRELYEESGATEYKIQPLCDYYAEDEVSNANGMVFIAQIEKLGPLPESEMAETALYESLPENLTYPGITPVLFNYIIETQALPVKNKGHAIRFITV